MYENFEIGSHLSGSILKDGEVIYSDKMFQLEGAPRFNTPPNDALAFYIYDGNRPHLNISDECILRLKSGREIVVRVFAVDALAMHLFVVGFYFYLP